MMQAVILAAGRGSRLGQKGEQRPKCLLELDRRPLIDYQLEALADAGIAPVAMVVGYCADEIRETVGISAEYIENPRWSTTNSLYSFYLTRDWVQGDVLILNADTVFHPDVLDRLLDQEGDAFAYDSGSGNGREHMKVCLDACGRLIDMRKDMPADEASGENVGMLKFTAATARRLFGLAEQLVADGQERCWLGSAVRRLAGTAELRGVDVAGLPWGEIDSGYDLARVRKEVVPAVKNGTRSRHPLRRVARYSGVAMASFLPLVAALYLWWTGDTRAWENLDIQGAPRAKIAKQHVEQTWWMLTDGAEAMVRVHGPAQVRVDSRQVLPDEASGRVPYVIEISRDGKRLDWFKHAERPSTSWTHGGEPLAQRTSVDLEVPSGAHRIGLRVVASQSGRTLVRVRRFTTDDEDVAP